MKELKQIPMEHEAENIPSQELSKSSEGKETYSIEQRDGDKECPFMVVKCEKGYFIAMGNARMSDVKKTAEECWRIIDEKPWGLIFVMVNYILTQRIMGGLVPQKGEN